MADAHADFFLAPSEIELLTGFKLPTRQCRWFGEKGWCFVVSGSGRPVVARKYVEKMLGCGTGGDERRPRPNFAALRAA